MADERMSSLRNIDRKVEEGVGRAVNDATTGTENLMDQTSDVIQDAFSKTVGTATEGAQSIKRAAIASHDFFKEFMEDNPHTTTAIALGIGLLIGYAATRQPPRRGWWD